MHTLKEIETIHIKKALLHFEGHRTNTAKALGISLRTLHNKLKAMGIEPYSCQTKAEMLEKTARKLEVNCFPTNEERVKYLDTFPNKIGIKYGTQK